MNKTKEFGKFFIANLKRTAQMISPMVREKTRLLAEIAEKQKRINYLDSLIETIDNPVKKECGYGVEDLIIKRVVETGNVDKDGKPVKITKWELKYPETIIPIDGNEQNKSNIEKLITEETN